MYLRKTTQKNLLRKHQNPTIEISCDPKTNGFFNIIEGPVDNAITLQFNPNQNKMPTKEVPRKNSGEYKHIHNQPQTLANFRNCLHDIRHQVSNVCRNLKNLNDKFCSQEVLENATKFCSQEVMENATKQKYRKQNKQYCTKCYEPARKKDSNQSKTKIKKISDECLMTINRDNRKFCKNHNKIHEDNHKSLCEKHSRVPQKNKCIICSKNYPKYSHLKNTSNSSLKQHKSPHIYHRKRSHEGYCGLYMDRYNTQQSGYHDKTSYRSIPDKELSSNYVLTSDQEAAIEYLEQEYSAMIKYLKKMLINKYLNICGHHCKQSQIDHNGLHTDHYHEAESSIPYKNLPDKYHSSSYKDLNICQEAAIEYLDKEYYTIIKYLKNRLMNKYSGKKLSSHNTNICKENALKLEHSRHQIK